MKKLLFTLFIILLLFYGCESKTVETKDSISITDVDSLTITALPSPPQIKTIENKDEIEKIINHINSINKSNIEEDNINGWEFLIKTKGNKEHLISLVGDKININGTFYKVSKDELSKFRDLYNSLEAKEENAT